MKELSSPLENVGNPLANISYETYQIVILNLWRGDRVADGAALEMRFTISRDVGSNPTLSASKFIRICSS